MYAFVFKDSSASKKAWLSRLRSVATAVVQSAVNTAHVSNLAGELKKDKKISDAAKQFGEAFGISHNDAMMVTAKKILTGELPLHKDHPAQKFIKAKKSQLDRDLGLL